MQIVIDIPEEIYNSARAVNKMLYDAWNMRMAGFVCAAIANGTPLPKGHGRIIDISKIDEDRIDKDNPIIYLTLNGEYIEAVSLDYLNNLSTIIEADKESEDKE